MGRVSGKVAFITGGARGQGRSHALRLAEEGADIIVCDLIQQIDSIPYPMSTAEDLAETVRLVEGLDRRIMARQVDVRDQAGLDSLIADAIAEFGHIDIVCANAGIMSMAPTWEITDESWSDMIDVNLTGVWRTLKAVVPSMIAAKRGGSIVITSSTAGIRGFGNLAHYTAAKHGVVGLMLSLANEVAQHNIRVNTIHPTNVATGMILNDATYKLFAPHLEKPTRADAEPDFLAMNLLPVPWIEAVDISNAILFLASDEARYITGVQLPVDAGQLAKNI
jgi:SDR family mycofactocin-dependent oxidoreductase